MELDKEAAVTEFTQTLINANSQGRTVWEQLPEKPVHGNSRSYGYLDADVGSLSLKKHPSSLVVTANPAGAPSA